MTLDTQNQDLDLDLDQDLDQVASFLNIQQSDRESKSRLQLEPTLSLCTSLPAHPTHPVTKTVL